LEQSGSAAAVGCDFISLKLLLVKPRLSAACGFGPDSSVKPLFRRRDAFHA